MSSYQSERLRSAYEAYRDGEVHRAFALYEELAAEGHAESQVFVAWMLTEGVGCSKDERRAATYYERAASLGHAVGSFYYGRWLTKTGAHTQAFDFYSRSAQQDYVPSIFRMGYSLARGKGVDPDVPRAYAALKAAAVRGHAYAIRELAIQDMQGGRGIGFIPIGVVEFFVALFWGVAVSVLNKDSDLLRG